MKTKITIMHNVFMIICMFLLVFLPPLSGISMTYIMMAFMILYIMIRNIKKRKILLRRDVGLRLISGFLPFLLYILLQTVFNVFFSSNEIERSAYIFNFSHVIITLVYVAVCYIFFISFSSSFSSEVKLDWVKWLVLGATIETVFIFMAFFNRNLHDTFVSLYLNNTKGELMLASVAKYKWRAYGLSGYYFDNLAFILSGAGLLAILRAFDEKKTIYYILGFLMFLASILGSRTGIVLIICGFIMALIYYGRKNGFTNMLKWVFILLFSLIGIYFFLNILSEDFRTWIKTGMNAVISIMANNSREDAFVEILGKDIVFPPNIIFGIGAKPETLNYYDIDGHHIDNGYIQIIWRFGIIGLLLLGFGVVRFYKTIIQNANDNYTKGVSIVLPIVLLLYLFKFYPISTYGAQVIYFVLPAVMYSTSKMKETKYGQL